MADQTDPKIAALTEQWKQSSDSIQERMRALRQKQKMQEGQDTAAREAWEQQQRQQQEAERAPLLDAADKYMAELAGHLAESINGKIDQGKAAEQQHGYGRRVVFDEGALAGITPAEVEKMDGYAKLKEACARPDMNMCLGSPDYYGAMVPAFKKKDKSMLPPEPPAYVQMEPVVIYIDLPYSFSKLATQSKPKRKGFAKLLHHRSK